MESITCLLLCLSLSLLLFSPPSKADSAAAAANNVPSGMIQRTTKEQILATIPPDAPENAQPFLTSPSGKYTAYLLRRGTAPQAGGFGNDFCYIQIQDTASGGGGDAGGASVWESECEPVSSSNACSLVFDDDGLAVFDGSHSLWDTSANRNDNYPATVQLVDEGDMRVIDKDGDLVWRASNVPRLNQRCGMPGSPGMAPESPPFSGPIGGNRNRPFGQDQQTSSQSPITQLTDGDLNQQQQQQQQQQQPPLAAAPPTDVTNGDQQPAGDDQEQQPSLPAAPPTDATNGDQQPVGDQEQQPPSQAPPTDLTNGNQQPPLSAAPSEGPSALTNGGLGQQQSPMQQPLQGLNNGASQASSGTGGAQPLVDNNPYDSGCTRKEAWIGTGFAVVGLLLFHGFGV